MLYPYNNFDYLVDLIDRSQLNALGQTYIFNEKTDSFVCSIPLPGADKADIKISVAPDSVLSISYNPTKKNPYAPPFSRLWTLKNVDYDGLTADYNNGILSVMVPKLRTNQTKTRTFNVN
jgi:HSP20 family molecular chaperone IbpA